MYSLFPDSKSLKMFFNLSQAESFDVYFRGEKAYFVCNTDEVFALLKMDCIKTASEGDAMTHLPKAPFQKLAGDGSLLFSLTDNQVEVSFLRETNEIFCRTVFNRQEVNDISYSEKMEIALDTSVVATKKFKVEDLGVLPKLVGALGGVLRVGGETASIITPYNCRVYKKLGEPAPFACSMNAKQIGAIAKVSSYFYGYHQFLVAKNKQLVILARQMRNLQDVELDDLLADKSYYSSQVHLHNVFQFMSNMKFDQTSLELDVQKRECVFTSNSCTYKVPYIINGENRPEGCKFQKYSFPAPFFNAVLKILPGTTFTLEQHANFVLMIQNDYVVEG